MSDNIARDEIMAKLRHAADGSAYDDIPAKLQSFDYSISAELPSTNLCEAFLANVIANHGTVDCAYNRKEAAAAVAKFLHQQYRTRKVVAGSDPRLAAMPWRDGGVLPRFGTAGPSDLAGISYARLGVAETGSIITYTGKVCPAENNLLVESHIVLLDVTDLVTTLDQAWDFINSDLDSDGRPRGINFISGPSSTADIEGRLVLGAHGPKHWHVVLVGEMAETVLENAKAIGS
ncbi:MAG: L-lactate dehydrogenase complex protein LldG [Halioglobus sp.]